MGKVKYIKCPRCELNYIPDTEEMCDVCKAELGLKTDLTLLDDIIDEEEPLKLCPVCKTAYIGLDEDMCENCLALAAHEEVDPVTEEDDGWRTFLDDEPEVIDEGTEIPLDELEEEFPDDDFEDEENAELELDDYPDDIDDFEDEDFEDEEDVDDADDEEE